MEKIILALAAFTLLGSVMLLNNTQVSSEEEARA